MNEEMRETERWNDPAAAFLTVRRLPHVAIYALVLMQSTCLAEEEGEEEQGSQVPNVPRPASASEPLQHPARVPMGWRRPQQRV